MARRGPAERQLFPPDRGLQLRMVTAVVGTPLLVFAAVALAVLVLPLRFAIGLGVAAAIGLAISWSSEQQRPARRATTPAEEPALHGIVDRLCVVADLPKPEIIVEPERQPNSWVTGMRREGTRVHVTRALLDLLTPAELEAVIAHELAHVAHRDAAVMTAVAGPSVVLREGGRRALHMWPLTPAGAVALAIAHVAQPGTLALSRYREIAADAGAVAMTGRAAALASALLKVSGGIAAIPSRDLRAVAVRDTFHLVPVERRSAAWADGPFGRLVGRFVFDSHPPLEQRIARLDRLERRMHAARGPGQA